MITSTFRTGRLFLVLSVLLALTSLPAVFPHPNSPKAGVDSPLGHLYQEALERYQAGKFTEAADLLESALELNDQSAGSASLLGWCRLRQGDIFSSRRAFERAARIAPDSADPWTGLGYVALREQRPGEAEARFLRALETDSRSLDAWKGLARARRDRGDRQGAHKAVQRVLELDGSDEEGQVLLSQILGPQGILEERRIRKATADNTPLRMVSRRGNGYLEVKTGGRFRPLFVKGVNLGTALPGKFPAEFPDDPDLYRQWFEQMSDLGLNVVRLYTLHPPSLYRTLHEHNRRHPDRKLWLVQGVWTELPPNDDYDDPQFFAGFQNEIIRVIDAIHGNLELPPRPGHAHGVYETDVSEDVLALLLGREWEPYSVVAYEKIHPDRDRFEGKFMRAVQARPFEAWLASICEVAAKHETRFYRWQHPVGYVSWPTLDPLHHPTEATVAEEMALRRARGEELDEPIREYENDAVNIDALHIRPTQEFRAGFFASYHAYPYYPEFMMLDPGYGRARDHQGPSHYFGYLQALKRHHQDQPVLIAEFGVPTSRGIAHLQPEKQHHGGHNTVEQGKINARLFRNIHDAGLGGGILFAWMDEWFKRNWLVMAYESPSHRNPLWLNALDPEQNFGLLAARPGKAGSEMVVDGQGEDWKRINPLYIDEGPVGRSNGKPRGSLRAFRVTSDEAYLYLRLDRVPVDQYLNGKEFQYWVGIDTYDARRGDSRFPSPADNTIPIGMEFLVQFAGEGSRILVDPAYDLFTMRNRRPYGSVENSDGQFAEIRVYTNRDRFGRDGTYYPPKSYSRSPLRHASLDPSSPDFDSLADWMESPGGDFIEVRIPWGLLNVADPSSRQVIHEEAPRTGRVDTRTTEGFRFHVLALRGEAGDLEVFDQLPPSPRPVLADYPFYRLPKWESPRYHLVLKESYSILKTELEKIPEYTDDK